RLSILVNKIDEHEQERARLSKLIPELGEKISNHVYTLRDLKQQIDHNRKSLKAVESEELQCQTVVNAMDHFLTVVDGELEHLKQVMKKEALDSAMGRLAVVHKTITDQNTVKSLVDDFEQQLSVAKKKHFVAKEI